MAVLTDRHAGTRAARQTDTHGIAPDTSFPEQLLGISWEVPDARPVKSRCGYAPRNPW